jgi:hypothetical protein
VAEAVQVVERLDRAVEVLPVGEDLVVAVGETLGLVDLQGLFGVVAGARRQTRRGGDAESRHERGDDSLAGGYGCSQRRTGWCLSNG